MAIRVGRSAMSIRSLAGSASGEAISCGACWCCNPGMGKCVSEISSEPDVASVSQPIDTEALYEELRLTANAGNIMSDEILAKLRGLPIPERERLSFETGSRTVYFPEESGDVVATEEAAALKAMPYGYDISQLNGLNVGCAARTVSPYLISVDIAREAGDATGVSN